jgi:hypothetical protein
VARILAGLSAVRLIRLPFWESSTQKLLKEGSECDLERYDWNEQAGLISMRVLISTFLPTLFFSILAHASPCIPIEQARAHIGEVKCVTGKVLRVKTNDRGAHFLDFCADSPACPFTVVVFPADLRDVGDVRQLAGRVIEIRGAVKLYDNRAEIILNRIGQLSGGARMIPPVSKAYDVETRGRYSPGRFRPGTKPKKTKGIPSLTATYGDEMGDEEPPH